MHGGSITCTMPRAGIFLSYPRSGNSLTRSLLACLIGTTDVVIGYRGEPAPAPLPDDLHLTLHSAPLRLLKRHAVDHIPPWATSGILLHQVREPVEAIESELKDTILSYRYVMEQDAAALNTHIRSARTFIAWENRTGDARACRSPRLLLHYEQVVAEPEHVLSVLGAFLQIDEDRVATCRARRSDVVNVGLATTRSVGHRDPESIRGEVPASPPTPTNATMPPHTYLGYRGGVLGGTRLPIPSDVWPVLGQPYPATSCVA